MCTVLLIEAKGKCEVLKQKVELNFQSAEVELLQDSLALDHRQTLLPCCISCPTFCVSLTVTSHVPLIDLICSSGGVFAYDVGEVAAFSESEGWSNTGVWKSLGLSLGFTLLIKPFWFCKCSYCLANWWGCFVDFISALVLLL